MGSDHHRCQLQGWGRKDHDRRTSCRLPAKEAPALLVDGDANRSATVWGKRGELPFKVVDERQAARYARNYEHVIIDTEARPEEDDLKALADGCDLLVIPTTPDALALDALMLTVKVLQDIGTNSYRVLLTIIPPRPSRDGEEARSSLQQRTVPFLKPVSAGSLLFRRPP